MTEVDLVHPVGPAFVGAQGYGVAGERSRQENFMAVYADATVGVNFANEIVG